ncbi:glycoside hydrolase superfamily [Pyrenochaeta sp. MPI-SDFR-AT-0127]|nr:glycoside hydrolase superfamily [Pyrenochaeta sp. MPI-SDFR-AT-0127]
MFFHLLCLAAAGVVTATPLNVGFDEKRVAADAVPLDRQLMSLSIEFGNTLDFFGDIGKPNLFSKQLLQNVVDRSHSPAILRIGGNTQDRADFCENCNETLKRIVKNDPNDPKTTEALAVTFNKNLFSVLTDNVPQNSPIIFGLNFRNNTYSIAQAEVDGALKYLDQSVVMAYELGNEVNLYGPFRPSGYNAKAYASQMRDWLPRLRERSTSHVRFQFPSFAGPPQDFNSDLTIAELVKLGVPQSIPGIEYYSVHGYPYNICSAADAARVNLTNFLDHRKTKNLINQYSAEIAASQSMGKEMHMGETGSVACHGKDGVSNTLGAALWELDYALSGASAGIGRFFFHMGQGDFYYSMWEPVGTPLNPGPHIHPTYYAMLFMADVVGDLTAPKVAPITSRDTSSAVHFAIFDGDKIQKLILLNTQFATSGSNRTSLDFDVKSILGANLEVRRLTGAYSAAKTGVTWAGQSADSAGKIVGDQKVERINNGVVTLLASEAVLVERQ